MTPHTRTNGIADDDRLMRIAMCQEQKNIEAARQRVARVKELERRYAPLVAGLGELNQRVMSNTRSAT